jgi:concanavalin A-like lectin/glucanase superfamily protein
MSARRFIIGSFVLGLAWAQVAGAQTTTVTFDTAPAPECTDGVFQGIDFGTGQWQWSGSYYVNSTNHIYFADSTGTSRTFQFSPAPQVMQSMSVYSVTPGVLTLADDTGQTLTSEVTTGALQLVTTGWTRPSTRVTVSFTGGWDLGVDDITFTAKPGRGAGSALRFFGTGFGDVDRVKIPLENRPVNIGATDTTVEWWMRANPGENPTNACTPGADTWIFGNVIFDRDIIGPGDFGDWGISLRDGRLAVGVDNGTAGVGICGTTDLADGAWHHVAVTRRFTDGLLQIFVDGRLDGEGIGPPGDISYRSGRPTIFPLSEPFLVIGAEKHDAGPLFPSFRGWVDEVRLSTAVRYTSNFVRPSQPFTPDPQTAALYHFDEGAGDQISDSSSAVAGPSDGLRRFGGFPGSPAGPEWVVSDAPLQ